MDDVPSPDSIHVVPYSTSSVGSGECGYEAREDNQVDWYSVFLVDLLVVTEYVEYE